MPEHLSPVPDITPKLPNPPRTVELLNPDGKPQRVHSFTQGTPERSRVAWDLLEGCYVLREDVAEWRKQKNGKWTLATKRPEVNPDVADLRRRVERLEAELRRLVTGQQTLAV